MSVGRAKLLNRLMGSVHAMGYTPTGVFDPHHTDFNTLLNNSVTARSAWVVAAAAMGLMLVEAGTLFAFGMNFLGSASVLMVVNMGFLVYAIRRDNYRFMIPAIAMLVIFMLGYLIVMLMLLTAAAVPFSDFTNSLERIIGHTNMDSQVMLIILGGFCCWKFVTTVFLVWSMYVHYSYLYGLYCVYWRDLTTHPVGTPTSSTR